jgi:hypothetical protein
VTCPKPSSSAIDANAALLGLSRSEYVRRLLAQAAARTQGVSDLHRFANLCDESVTGLAWS